MKSECCVYSITVGELDYIGVTKDYNARIKEHAKSAYCKNSNLKIHQAMRESRGGFSAKIIFHGSEQECFDIEKKLRPNADIGLNTTQGGRKEKIEGIAPSQNTYKIEGVRLERLRPYYKYDNAIIKTDRGEYIDFDNHYDKWKSVEGCLVSAHLTGKESDGWEWMELNHVIKTTSEKSK